jgi:hypothetical protein
MPRLVAVAVILVTLPLLACTGIALKPPTREPSPKEPPVFKKAKAFEMPANPK